MVKIKHWYNNILDHRKMSYKTHWTQRTYFWYALMFRKYDKKKGYDFKIVKLKSWQNTVCIIPNY